MDSKIKSSFIPKDAGVLSSKPSSKRSGSFDLLVLGSIILFVASVSMAIGVFLYVQFLDASLTSRVQQLERAREAFEPALIQELTRLDNRMQASAVVLQNHYAPTALFRKLEELTLQTVSFETMDFQVVGPNSITVNLSGRARSVNSIALQADLFGKDAAIVSPIFSNITREQGGVLFDVSATINPSSIRYVNVFANRNVREVVPAEGQPSEEDNSIPLFAP